jgi:predicted ATP-grasp superfamily ATP-dependent carboligase
MTKLRTLVDRESEEFKENAEAYEALLEELRDRTQKARRRVARRRGSDTRSAASCWSRIA